MQNEIMVALEKLSADEGVRILYACESGSRAWGFESSDSDYDVRFVYLRPLSWHLKLEKQADTMERMLPQDLDVSGWELAKTLRLFAECNLALYEWIQSPVVYVSDSRLIPALRPLIPAYFNPRKAFHHYFSMAHNEEHAIPGNEVRLKKAFYGLRALLACQWILERNSMPPTEFARLLELSVPDGFLDSIHELLERKREATESDRAELPGVIGNWIKEVRSSFPERALQVPGPSSPGWPPLDAIFRDYLLPA